MRKTLYYLTWVSLICLLNSFQAQAQAPAQCDTVYGVHDEGVEDTQFFTYDLKAELFQSKGEQLEAYDIEALDVHPQTRQLFATSGKKAAQLYQVDGNTGEPKLIGDIGFDNVVGLAFHTQGRLMAWSDQGLLELDIDSAKGTLIWPQTTEENHFFKQFGPFSIQALAWNLEGTRLYGVAADQAQASTLWVYDDTGWNVACNGLPHKVESLKTLPTGLLIYAFHHDKQLGIHTYDPNTCQTITDARLDTPYNDIEGIAWPLPCTVSNLEALRAYLESLEGVEAVEITPEGAITVTQNGEIHRSQLDEVVTQGTPPSDGLLVMESIGDVNGDNVADLRVTYPNGDRQILYYFGVDKPTPLPVITIKHAETVAPGELLSITIESDVAFDDFTLVLTVNGTPIEVDAQGNASFSSETPGLYLLEVTVTNSKGNTTSANTRLIVTAPFDNTPPVVTLASPNANAEITAPTAITGTVFDEHLVEYILAWSPIDKEQYTRFASGTTTVNNGILGTFDPSLLINGWYDIRVTATDANNQTTIVERTFLVSGDLKVGNFSFTVEDFSVPMMGMPLEVLRTYDTRRKGEALDFGYGWSINYQNTKIEESQVPGEGWTKTVSGYGFSKKVCINPIGSHQVTVTLPNGQMEAFEVEVQPACRTGLELITGDFSVTVVFQPQEGTFSRLEPLDSVVTVESVGKTLVDPLEPALFNPNRYKLTTQAGYEYELEQNFGIRRITDPNGNTLTYTNDGIIHSAGKSILFTRDHLNRITKITDPKGNSFEYQYNDANDLVAVVDPQSNTVRYTYTPRHELLEIQDPLGRKLVRNIYDDAGRLVAQIDAEGNRTDFTHDLEGREEVVRDRRGFVTTYIYDEKGNVLTEIDAKGHATYHTYDTDGNELSHTDPLGRTTVYTYDAHGNILTKKDPQGYITKSVYDERDNLLKEEDPNGNVLAMSYDPQNNLLQASIPSGQTFQPVYDSAKRATATLNGRGEPIVSFTYNNDGNPVTQTDALGNVTLTTYDASGNELTQLKTRTGADGNPISLLTTTVYDNNGKPTQTTDAAGYVTSTEYDVAGQVLATVDKNGYQTTFEYDTLGRLIKTNYPDGTSTSSTYDANGNQIRFTDRQGHLTQYRYDYQNRLVETVFPDQTSISQEYDAVGQVLAEVDASGNRTTFEYGKGEQPIKITDALGQSIQFTYDGVGNRTSMTDASGQTIQFEYDAGGKPTKVIYPDNTFTQAVYDDLGRRVQEIDRAGNLTRYEYDALGRLTKVIDAKGGETSYRYDEVGNLLRETDALGHTSSWTYDNLGRPLSHTLPLGMTETFTYDGNGNVLTHTNFNGDTIRYSYDSNNQVLKETYPDGSIIRYTYTNNGLPATLTDSRGVTRYSYDMLGRLLKVVHPQGASLEYTYDANGNRTSVTTPSGRTTYTYDPLNRLTRVTDSDEGITNYVYDVLGNLTRIIRPNGTITVYHYDSFNRVVKLDHLHSDQSIIGSYEYTLNVLGYPTQVIEPNGRIVVYTYDELGRLVQENIDDPLNGKINLAYRYDAASNRREIKVDGVVLSDYSYDANNRLLNAGDLTYSYDANGNTLSQIGPEGSTTYRYDFKNRLVGVTTANDNIAYVYDMDGIRVSSTVNGVTTQYLVDKNRPYAQVLEERTLEGNLLTHYTYGNDLLSQKRGTENRYFHYDRLGSTRGLTDDQQNVTDAYHYDAFGNPLQIAGTTPNRYRFTGEQHDPQTGLIYLRARYYDSTIGRFLTQDTWQGQRSNPITLHKYLYANGNPVALLDPSGHVGIGGMIGSVVNSLSVLVRAVISHPFRFVMKRFNKDKKFQIYKGKELPRYIRRKGKRKAIIHWFVYVEPIYSPFGGFRYDAGPARLQLVTAFKRPFQEFPGHVAKEYTTKAELYRLKSSLVGPKGKFTIFQYLLWERVVFYPYQESPYSITGCNCWTWTIFALMQAKIIEKIPFYP